MCIRDRRNIGGFMEELIEVIQGLKQPGCIDYIQLGSAIVSVCLLYTSRCV